MLHYYTRCEPLINSHGASFLNVYLAKGMSPRKRKSEGHLWCLRERERERWVGFLFGLCPTKWFQSLDNSDIERILCLKMEVTSWCRIYSYKGASQSLLGHGGINSNNQFCLSVCFCTFIHFMCSFLNHFSIMFWTNVISCP